jgi:hypothetical protein
VYKIHYSNQGVTQTGLKKCVQISSVEKDTCHSTCLVQKSSLFWRKIMYWMKYSGITLENQTQIVLTPWENVFCFEMFLLFALVCVFWNGSEMVLKWS